MLEYTRHVDDIITQCFFCQSEKDLGNHFIPARDLPVLDKGVPVFSDRLRITLTACKTCRARVYNYRTVLTTFKDQMTFFSTKRIKRTPGHEVSSDFVRVSAEELELGYNVHPEAQICECFYCKESVRSTRDLIPCKHNVRSLDAQGIKIDKFIIPACTQCIGRIKPKEYVFNTIEERLNHINRLRAKSGLGAKRFSMMSSVKPWQRAMYDDAGIRHVLDIDDILLTATEKEAKDAWILEQSKLTT